MAVNSTWVSELPHDASTTAQADHDYLRSWRPSVGLPRLYVQNGASPSNPSLPATLRLPLRPCSSLRQWHRSVGFLPKRRGRPPKRVLSRFLRRNGSSLATGKEVLGRRCRGHGSNGLRRDSHSLCTPGSRALKVLVPSGIARGVIAAGWSRRCASLLQEFTPKALLASLCFTPPCLLGPGFASLLPSPSRSRRGGLLSFGCSMLAAVPLRPKRRSRSSLRAGST